MKITVNDYIKIRHGGDPSRVEFVQIDYSTVKTRTELLQWAYETFGLPLATEPFIKEENTKKVLVFLWDTLAARKQHYVILENYPRHKADDLRDILEGPNGWEQILGFHLSRDYLVEVAFLQNPHTKGKKPLTNPTS